MSLTVQNVKVVPEGDGVEVKRLFPLPEFMNFDPFVLWDHFEIEAGKGFPEHPHRGFEAITYMFSGGMNHSDNLGNNSFVSAGGAQRFTAGKGIIHSEMPANEGKSEGIQLWINLPKMLKTIEPEYQQVNQGEFPEVEASGVLRKILVGEGSALKIKTDIRYEHILFSSNASLSLDVPNEMRGLIYVMQGSVEVNQQIVDQDQAVFIENESRLSLRVGNTAEIMLCIGKPHKEAIHQYGPFVD